LNSVLTGGKFEAKEDSEPIYSMFWPEIDDRIDKLLAVSGIAEAKIAELFCHLSPSGKVEIEINQ